MEACWECGTVGEVHHHHPVPKSRGGTRTIPLCLLCHGKAHGRDGAMTTSVLVKDGLRKARMRGVQLGAPGYGRSNTEADAINLMVTMRLHGATLRAIVAELDRQGMPTQKGGAWTATTVRRILHRTVVF